MIVIDTINSNHEINYMSVTYNTFLSPHGRTCIVDEGIFYNILGTLGSVFQNKFTLKTSDFLVNLQKIIRYPEVKDI
jgi:hypothetical protein